MTKKELISSIKKSNREREEKQIIAACKAYDYLNEHKHKLYSNGDQSYLVNNNECFLVFKDLRFGILEFLPLSDSSDIGAGCGCRLSINFFNSK